MQDSCITVQEKVVVPAIVQEVQRQYKLDPLWDSLEETSKNHKEGFLFVNKDFINGVIVAKELFIPDDYNLDLYMELPEQEALELQEKYNIENGNNNFRN